MPFALVCQYVSLAAFLTAGVRLIRTDLRSLRLPDRWTAAAYLGVLLPLVAATVLDGRWERLGRAALAGVVLCAVFLGLALVNRRGLGMGDVKLAAAVGTGLGWVGWSTVILGGFLGFALAAAFGLLGVLSGRIALSSPLPFGPFMIVGAVAAVVMDTG